MNYTLPDYIITTLIWLCILPFALLALPWFTIINLLPPLKSTDNGTQLYADFYKLSEWFKE